MRVRVTSMTSVRLRVRVTFCARFRSMVNMMKVRECNY